MIVTLTTDFGTTDHFVGVMKGVILSMAPGATIVDISHGVPPQDVRKAYWILRETVFYFPPGTVHVVVVDPTVGSDRKIIYVKTRGHRFLAPDNGVLSFIAGDAIEEIYEIVRQNHSGNFSHTFHGRDIFAPVAGQLLQNVHPRQLGREINPETLEKIDIAAPVPFRDGIQGEIVCVDHFGNLITNISKSLLEFYAVEIFLGNIRLLQIHRHYSEVPPGEAVAVFNSSDLLEISCNCGNAAQKYGIGEGTPVRCVLHSKTGASATDDEKCN